jgi:hypothetical protein
MGFALALHETGGQAVEFPVDSRGERIEGGGVAIGPGEKKLGGFRNRGVGAHVASGYRLKNILKARYGFQGRFPHGGQENEDGAN